MNNVLVIEKFYLSIIIIGCIALLGYALGIIFSGKGNKGYKLSFLYYTILLAIYELSTLVAFYTENPRIFEIAVNLKIMGALLAKTAALPFFSYYVGKRWMIRFFLAAHFLSIPFIMPQMTERFFSYRLFEFTGAFEAVFLPSSMWYGITTNLLYIFAAFIFYFELKKQNKKGKAVGFIYFILAVNTLILTMIGVFSHDVLYEKMHILILLVLIAFVWDRFSLRDKKESFMLHANILDGMAEKVLIYNKKGHLAYVHDGTQGIWLGDKLEEVHSLLNRNATGDIEPEGQFTLLGAHPLHVYYKQLPILSDGRGLGSIIVMRNITHLVQIQKELEEKNALLHEAFEKQKAYAKLSKKLISEEERARILDGVNEIADAYIRKIKEELSELKIAAKESPNTIAERVASKNQDLLELTRSALEAIRGTVRKLSINSKGGTEL